MVIVKTLNEIRQHIRKFDTIHFTFSKNNFLDTITPNTSHMVSESKKFGSKTMASFWYDNAMRNELNPTNLMPTDNLEWDRDGCVAAAENLGIDIVWAPDLNDELDIVNISNIEYYKDLVDRLWNKEGYEINDSYLKASCITRLITNLGCKYFRSKNNSYVAFILMHFTNKYTDSRMSMVDVLKSPEGIYYTPTYDKYTSKEKEVLARIEPTVLAFDLNGDLGILKDNIDAFGNEINLNLFYLQKYTNESVLGPGKKFVEMSFKVGTGENIKSDSFSFLLN